MPKDQGGLAILDLDLMNVALLSKWLWKLFNESGPWQQILVNKYLKKKLYMSGGSKTRRLTFLGGFDGSKKNCFGLVVKLLLEMESVQDFWRIFGLLMKA